MKKQALIVWGGWDGHQPELVSQRFKKILENENFDVNLSDSLDIYLDIEYLKSLDLIVPCWTGGELPSGASNSVAKAVGYGVGMAGCHGGMCDSFRNDTEWQFITGAQWVSHPGGCVDYKVNVIPNSSPITDGISDFPVSSEQYYIHIDPSIEVLATTRFPLATYWHASNKAVDVPVVFTKYWGNGRVFYNSLGHNDDVFDKSPSAEVIMKRGMLWASQGKQYMIDNNLTTERFENNAKMY